MRLKSKIKLYECQYCHKLVSEIETTRDATEACCMSCWFGLPRYKTPAYCDVCNEYTCNMMLRKNQNPPPILCYFCMESYDESKKIDTNKNMMMKNGKKK